MSSAQFAGSVAGVPATVTVAEGPGTTSVWSPGFVVEGDASVRCTSNGDVADTNSGDAMPTLLVPGGNGPVASKSLELIVRVPPNAPENWISAGLKAPERTGLNRMLFAMTRVSPAPDPRYWIEAGNGGNTGPPEMKAIVLFTTCAEQLASTMPKVETSKIALDRMRGNRSPAAADEDETAMPSCPPWMRFDRIRSLWGLALKISIPRWNTRISSSTIRHS
jgi:hypothetical protein